MENNNTTQTHVTQKLFTEMLRPQTLDQAIIVPRIREVLQHGLTTNILLCIDHFKISCFNIHTYIKIENYIIILLYNSHLN